MTAYSIDRKINPKPRSTHHLCSHTNCLDRTTLSPNQKKKKKVKKKITNSNDVIGHISLANMHTPISHYVCFVMLFFPHTATTHAHMHRLPIQHLHICHQLSYDTIRFLVCAFAKKCERTKDWLYCVRSFPQWKLFYFSHLSSFIYIYIHICIANVYFSVCVQICVL